MEMTTPVLSTVAPGGGNQATNIQFVMESRWVMGKKGPWQRGEEVIGEPVDHWRAGPLRRERDASERGSRTQCVEAGQRWH